MNNISDNKALQLQILSTNLKELKGLKQSDSPKWTAALEQELSVLPIRAIKQLSFLIDMLGVRVKMGEMPQ